MPAKKRVDSRAVKSKTGKTWNEWFALIDKIGGTGMRKREIVAYLATFYKLDPGWRQKIADMYKQSRKR